MINAQLRFVRRVVSEPQYDEWGNRIGTVAKEWRVLQQRGLTGEWVDVPQVDEE